MYQADIVIRNRKGNMGLAVELMAVVGKSPEWAAKTRQNLAEFGSMPDPSFFLLATPDRFFFWTKPTDGTDNKNLMYVMEIVPSDLSVSLDYCCVRIDLTEATASTLSVISILWSAKDKKATPVSAILD